MNQPAPYEVREAARGVYIDHEGYGRVEGFNAAADFAYAAGRAAAAAEIRAFVEMKERSVKECPPESPEAFRRNDAVLGAYRRAAEIAAGITP